MGTANSSAIACRLGNSGVRKLWDEHDLFHGKIIENTWRRNLCGGGYIQGIGHGRVEIHENGEPIALIFSMVDDFFVHGATKMQAYKGFTAFMDHSVKLGFICQPVKTSLPAQRQKFCGMIYDTTDVPTIKIPETKVSRGQATIEHLLRLNDQEQLSRLTVAVGGGFLQSLVDATPARIGQTYLRKVYDEVHGLEGHYGKELYYTPIVLSEACTEYLKWWHEFLKTNPGNTSRSGMAGTLLGTWGDGSGTGTGGTIEAQGRPMLQAWMGTWHPRVHHFSSNWKELRTLVWTMERIQQEGKDQRGVTIFYFTDNMTTYYVVQNGSSRSPELHKLIQRIKLLEVLMGCRIEVIHVPGVLMIDEGTDGLSQGLWLPPQWIHRSSLVESALALGPVQYGPALGQWALNLVGLPKDTLFKLHESLAAWSFTDIAEQTSLWIPSPEIARQAIVKFLDIWVESATTTRGIFLVPRIMQRDWGHISKHIVEIATIYLTTLPMECAYSSLIPFVVLYVPYFSRFLPSSRMDEPTKGYYFPKWHEAQAEHMRWL
jgi:hypothetical protein